MSDSRYPLRLYVKHRPIWIMLIASIIANAGIWTELFLHIRPSEESLFLHYNILFGVDLFGPWWRVLSLPFGGIIILLLNSGIGWAVFQKDRFASYLLHATALLCQLFLIIAAFLLVFLNV